MNQKAQDLRVFQKPSTCSPLIAKVDESYSDEILQDGTDFDEVLERTELDSILGTRSSPEGAGVTSNPACFYPAVPSSASKADAVASDNIGTRVSAPVPSSRPSSVCPQRMRSYVDSAFPPMSAEASLQDVALIRNKDEEIIASCMGREISTSEDIICRTYCLVNGTVIDTQAISFVIMDHNMEEIDCCPGIQSDNTLRGLPAYQCFIKAPCGVDSDLVQFYYDNAVDRMKNVSCSWGYMNANVVHKNSEYIPASILIPVLPNITRRCDLQCSDGNLTVCSSIWQC